MVSKLGKLSKKGFFGAVSLIVAAAIISITAAFGSTASVAAAPAFPGGSTRVGDTPKLITLYSGVITQTTRGTYSSSINTGLYDRIDVQYILSFSGTNTTTLTLLHSNNGSAWATGATVASGVTAAGTSMTSTFNYGRYTVISATLTNNNPVTVTVIGWLK